MTSIQEGQTTPCPKEKGQRDKQWSKKKTTKDWEKRALLKTLSVPGVLVVHGPLARPVVLLLNDTNIISCGQRVGTSISR